jgi:hypothetical protein
VCRGFQAIRELRVDRFPFNNKITKIQKRSDSGKYDFALMSRSDFLFDISESCLFGLSRDQITAHTVFSFGRSTVSDVIRGIDANGVSFFDQSGANLDPSPFREYSTEII